MNKKDITQMSEYSPKPQSFGEVVKVELDLSNYETKADLKNATGVDTSKFAKKVDSANLKSKFDKLDIDKLEKLPTNWNSLKSKVDKLVPVTVDLSKLSDVVNNGVVKKRCVDVYNAKIKELKIKYLILLTKLLILILMLK